MNERKKIHTPYPHFHMIVLIAGLGLLASCQKGDTVSKFQPAGLVVSPASGPTSEAGESASFTVVLSTQPQGNVVLSMASSDDKEGRLETPALTFTGADWNVPQTVTIVGVDDSVSDGNQPFEIRFDLSTSQDPAYAALRITSLLVINIDNDLAGFIVSRVSGPSSEAEDQVEFSIHLSAQPTANVTISFDSDDQSEGVVEGEKTLTFTTEDWNSVNKIIRVRGVNDEIADGNQPYRIVFSTTMSEDAIYASLSPAAVLIINIDNDRSGILVGGISGPTSEAGASGSFSVVLASEPQADVTLSVSSNDPSEGLPDIQSMTFTTMNWNAPQTVTVTGVDDELADGNQPYAIQFNTITSDDSTYASIEPADVVVINIDDDRSGILVSAISGPTTESGGSATFTVALGSEPEADVTVNFDSDDSSEGTVSVTSLSFSTLNWNAPQTITVSGVDDSVADGNQPYRVVFSNTTSTDATYAAITPNTVSVINTDNDNAEILVDSISGPTSESDLTTGNSASFSIQLTSAPIDTVTINVESDDLTEGHLDQSSVTFTTTDWSSQKVVRVTGQDDQLADGDQTYRIRFPSTVSTDPTYHGRVLSDIIVINNDNDTAGITVSRVEGLTTEGGQQITFSIVLNSQPTSDVGVSYDTDDPTEGTVAPANLTFTPVNWNAPQLVTVTGVDDNIADGNQPYRIVFNQTASNDGTYSAITPPGIVIINTDDDSTGIQVSSISGPTTESGASATFTVVMSSQPLGEVTLNLDSNDISEGTVSSNSLTFTITDWAAPQTITVTGVDDQNADGNQSYAIVFQSVSSSDASYAAIVLGPVSVVNTDNDSAGITVSAISGPSTEAGGTAQFSVSLNSQPTHDVQIRPQSSDLSEGRISVTDLFFTPVNWNAPQSVVITGQNDDLVDGNQAYAINFLPSLTNDSAYASLSIPSIPVINVDDDSAGIWVSPISGPISESGLSANFTLRLRSQPTADVQISFSSNDVSEGTLSVSTLTFTPSNWNAAQSVTVTGVDDALADGNQIFQLVFSQTSSSDTDYAVLVPASINVFNIDNDSAGILVSAISGPTREGGHAATFTVRLRSQPTADVALGLSSNDASEGIADLFLLTFSANNWNANQTVTVTGQDDSSADGDQLYQVVFTPSVSTDSDYSGISVGSVSIYNHDNDTAGVIVSAVSGPTTEAGGSASFSVVLRSQPTADVTVRFSSNDLSEGTLSVSTLDFTTANWNAPQTVTVTGVDDNIADGNQAFQISFLSSITNDQDYAALGIAPVSVVNIDNDTAGFLVSSVTGPISENGRTASFEIRLRSEPSAGVAISISSNDTSEMSLSPSSLTFTSSDYASPRTITLTGLDDDLADGDQLVQIIFAPSVSTDPDYSGLIPASLTVHNIDNDSAGFMISGISASTDENGAAATFSVRLVSEPTADVTLNFVSDDVSEGVLGASSLSFTVNNWAAPQTVTVTGQDDAIADGDQVYRIVFSAAVSTDSDYSSKTPASVVVYNRDNDSAAIDVSAMSGPVSESGGSASFDMVLRSQPSADVTLGFGVSDTSEGTLATTTLSFTTNNWNAPQSVIVTGVDDSVADGDQEFSISFQPATSADLDYASIQVASVSVTNVDDDSARILISDIQTTTSELGGTASFRVRLASQPTADVSITATSSNLLEGTVDPSSLTFTSSDWSNPQTVTVTGQDDNVADGHQVYQIVFGAATSLDSNYSGRTLPSVTVTNIDNETAGFLLTEISGPTTEGGGTASFTVALTSAPSDTVTISPSTSDATEVSVSPASLSFDVNNWDSPQAVLLTGLDDNIVDGNQLLSIRWAATSSNDAAYAALLVPDVAVSNIDDDLAQIVVGSLSRPTTEAGGQGSFTLSLASQPSASVSISFSSSDAGEGTSSPSRVSFDVNNWDSPQTITLTGVDDNVADGTVIYQIDFTAAVSSDPSYSGVLAPSLLVPNLDDDVVAVLVLGPSGPTTEAGGTATASISLGSQPTSDVTISLISSNSSEGLVSPSSLTIVAANWNVPHLLTVTGMDDAVADGAQTYRIDLAITGSGDPLYLTLASVPAIPMLNTDDDFALNLSASHSVLIYQTTTGGASVGDAADNLGVANNVTSNEQDFISAFDQGGFDLIVVDDSDNALSPEFIDRLMAWVSRGQKLILSYGQIYNHDDLMAAVGVTKTSTFSSGRSVFQDRSVPVNIFNLPVDPGGQNSWTQFGPLYFSGTDYGYAVDGAELALAEPGLILGRYDASRTGPGALMLTKHGRVFVHGFVTRNYAINDNDHDGTHDLRELYENEILYFYTRSMLGQRTGFVEVPAGVFVMGASADPLDPFQDNDEWERDVTITRDYFMGRTEVTNRLYESLVGSVSSNNFTSSCGWDCPAQRLSWETAATIANSLSARDGLNSCMVFSGGAWSMDLDCNGYRLPTEAEWEYAAKAGTTTMIYTGDFTNSQCSTTEPEVPSAAWFCGNALSSTRPVAYLLPNAYGLYDMMGNVWEWVFDHYGIYSFQPEVDPMGPASGGDRIVRGGSHVDSPALLRAAERISAPSSIYDNVGFRLVRTVKPVDTFRVDREAGATAVGSSGTDLTFLSLVGGTPGDDGKASVALPFTFPFLGNDVSMLYVSTNGFIAFADPNIAFDGNNVSLPAPTDPEAVIAGWWDDLEIGAGTITYETLGTTPNRTFLVHFNNVNRISDSNATVSFSFHLFETTNVIEVHYGQVAAGTSTWSASLGWSSLQTDSRGANVLFCGATCDETRFPSGEILRYVPTEIK